MKRSSVNSLPPVPFVLFPNPTCQAGFKTRTRSIRGHSCSMTKEQLDNPALSLHAATSGQGQKSTCTHTRKQCFFRPAVTKRTRAFRADENRDDGLADEAP